MYLVYIDESGDDGLIGSPTNWYILNCVLIHEKDWLRSLNELVTLRGDLKKAHNIPARKEIKGIHFRNGRGVFVPLRWSLSSRMQLYRELLEFEANVLGCKTFSVAIEKVPANNSGWLPFRTVWRFALERIQKFCEKENENALILHDEGKGPAVQRMLRFMRRHNYVPKHFGSGSINFAVTNILEDPIEKKSDHSYFIQLADWNAYATHRSSFIEPVRRVNKDLWTYLGNSILTEVNKLRGGPPGIVKYP